MNFFKDYTFKRDTIYTEKFSFVWVSKWILIQSDAYIVLSRNLGTIARALANKWFVNFFRIVMHENLIVPFKYDFQQVVLSQNWKEIYSLQVIFRNFKWNITKLSLVSLWIALRKLP